MVIPDRFSAKNFEFLKTLSRLLICAQKEILKNSNFQQICNSPNSNNLGVLADSRTDKPGSSYIEKLLLSIISYCVNLLKLNASFKIPEVFNSTK
jgi:hypothetical protein